MHLLYKVVRDLTVYYSLYTHKLSEMVGSDFGDAYKSVQMYEIGNHCRLFAMAW